MLAGERIDLVLRFGKGALGFGEAFPSAGVEEEAQGGAGDGEEDDDDGDAGAGAAAETACRC